MLLTKVSGIPLEVKASGEDGTIEGYGSIFGNVDSYGEMVMPGAFSASLVESRRKGRSIKMLWQHDPDRPVGVWEDLAEDSKGLFVKGRLLIDESAQAREAYGLIKAGAVDGLSIGYRLLESEQHADKPNVLTLTKVDLREVSIVTFAANERARVESVKHILAAGQLPTVREFEEFLRDAGGFSKRLAAAIAAKATPCLRGDPASEVSSIEILERIRAGLAAD
jgi:HK97 family phage prohead protease